MKAVTDQQNRGPIFKVNLLMLAVLGQGGLAYLLWPSTKEWWMLGFFSIILGAATIATAMRVLHLIWQIYRRDMVFAAFRAKGNEQKSSRMASHDAMRDAGMLDV